MERKNEIKKIQRKKITLLTILLTTMLTIIPNPSKADDCGSSPTFSQCVPLPTPETYINDNYEPVFQNFIEFMGILAGITVLKLLVMK